MKNIIVKKVISTEFDNNSKVLSKTASIEITQRKDKTEFNITNNELKSYKNFSVQFIASCFQKNRNTQRVEFSAEKFCTNSTLAMKYSSLQELHNSLIEIQRLNCFDSRNNFLKLHRCYTHVNYLIEKNKSLNENHIALNHAKNAVNNYLKSIKKNNDNDL